MTAKQLRELLAAVPDDAVVVVPGSDHSYREAQAEVTTAMAYRVGLGRGIYLCEDHGDGFNDDGGRRVPAVLIGR